MRAFFYFFPRFSLTFLLLASSLAVAQQKTLAPPEFASWLPVSDADRAQKTPSVEKDAGAEILLWRVHVVDELLGSNQDLQRAQYHYIRLKIFDQKGKEKAATIDIPYREPGAILDVAGRTIRPDGSTVELDRKSIYKRDLVRAGRQAEKAVSFAMPGVEPGAIIEYRWKQTEDDNRFRYLRMQFAREFPVRQVTWFVKPLSQLNLTTERMYMMPFNCKPTPVKFENDGYSSTTVENVPANRDEPYSPSDPNVQQWALLYYRDGDIKAPGKYWNEEGKKLYQEMRETLKADDGIKAGAASVANAKTTDEKVAGLLLWVRKNVRNVFGEETTDAERQEYFRRLPRDHARNTAEILKSGLGTSREVNFVFAALATQAGLDPKPALVADRGEILFNPNTMTDRYFLDNLAIAIAAGGNWRIVDASARLLSPGMLPWREEGEGALLGDSKNPTVLQSAIASPADSNETRNATLELSADGELTGDVEEISTGHRAEELREELDRKNSAQRGEWLRDRIIRMFPDADVTRIVWDGADDSAKPLTVRYHLDAPRFAQVTGKRILFQPNAFRRGQASPFTSSERRFAVQFPFAWKETDTIRVRLPEGFDLDNADSPGELTFGDAGGYSFRMTIAKANRAELTAHRELTFGNKGAIYFEAQAYPQLKKVFDEVQVRDAHSISLKGN